MVTKRGLTLTALVVLATSCASQPQIRASVLGYDTRTFEPEHKIVLPIYRDTNPADQELPSLIKIGYDF